MARTYYDVSERTVAFGNDLGSYPIPSDKAEIVSRQAAKLRLVATGAKWSKAIRYTYNLVYGNGLVAFGYLDANRKSLAEFVVTAEQAEQFPTVGEKIVEYYEEAQNNG